MNEEALVDVVLLMRPPIEWWPLGVVGYPGDHNGVRASNNGHVPDSSVVTKEFHLLTTLLVEKAIPHVIMNFPSELDFKSQSPKGAYDAVFLRDCAVIAPTGTAYVPVRFRDSRRQSEAPFVWQVLDTLGLQRLCDTSDLPGSVEGGDTITGILPNGEGYLFTGIQRNDQRGSAFLREILKVSECNHVSIATELCHIDSLMCTISRPSVLGWNLQSLVLCPELVSSGLTELTRLMSDQGLGEPIVVRRCDTSADGGTLAINGITVRSSSGNFLISGAQFDDQGRIEREMDKVGFLHVSSSLSQYLQFSSGGVRCCTQVVRVSMAALRRLSTALPLPEIEEIWVPH